MRFTATVQVPNRRSSSSVYVTLQHGKQPGRPIPRLPYVVHPLFLTHMSLIPVEDPGAEHSPMLRLALFVRSGLAWHGRQIWVRPDLVLSRPSRPLAYR